MKVTDSVDVAGLVEKGKVHVGLVGRRSENSELEFKPFATDETVVIVPPTHRWLKIKRVFFQRFKKEPLFLREKGSGSRWRLEQALASAGYSLRDCQISLELGSDEAIKKAVLQDMGVSVLSMHAVRRELKGKQLHTVNVTELALERKLFITIDKRRVLPAAARIFLDFLEGCPDAISVF